MAGRNIVLCFDGTSNNVTGQMTNVLRLYKMLERSDAQLAWYDSGVGTVVDPEGMTTFHRLTRRIIDFAIGFSIRRHFCAAYAFLAQNYRPGDQIYLFGFSRGAYTARALAGAIKLFGIPRPELAHLAELAWSIYANDAGILNIQDRFGGSERFRESFSIEVCPKVHFVGVWDTVSSYGWFGDLESLPHTRNNEVIEHVRHAIAIDERRAFFRQNRFEQSPEQLSFKQVWFAGCHSDVGGGYPEANSEAQTAFISLEWMLREAEGLGLRILDTNRKDGFKNHLPGPPNPKSIHESLTGKWKLVEFVPRRAFNSKKKRKAWRLPNFFKRRTIFDGKPVNGKVQTAETVHISVIERKEQTGYNPPNLPKDLPIET